MTTENENLEIYQAISNTLAPDAEKRRIAEKALANAHQLPVFPMIALNLAVDPSIPLDHRQMAALVLKKYVDTHWTQKSDNFVPPEPAENVKNQLRGAILDALKDPVSKIQSALAAAVSRIAYFDWPENWPGLFDNLLQMVKSQDAILVQGALKVLADFVHDDMTDQQFPQMASVLIPELFLVFASEKYSTQSRCQSLQIFRDFIDMLYTLKDEYPKDVQLTFDSLMAQWIPAFQEIITETSNMHINVSSDIRRINIEVYNTLLLMLQQFPSAFRDILGTLVDPSLIFLERIVELYVSVEILGTDLQTGHDEDDSVSIENMIYIMFEYVSRLATHRIIKKSVMEDPSSQFINRVFSSILKSVQITTEQEEHWENDPNQFLADEDEFSVNLTVRAAADELITSFLQSYSFKALGCLLSLISNVMSSSKQAGSSGYEGWWKPMEASLYILGGVADNVIEAMERNQVQFDLAGLFDHIVQHLLVFKDQPFILGRALWFSSKFARILPVNLVQKYCEASVEALLNSSNSASVRVSAIKAVQNFLQLENSTDLSRYQGAMIEGGLSLLPNVTEDTLLLLLETLGFAIKVNSEITASYAEALSRTTIELWKKNISDQLVCSVLAEIFETLAGNQYVYHVLISNSLGPLLEVINSSENLFETSEIRASALEMTSYLLKGGPTPIPNDLLVHLFPVIIGIALNPELEDASILQNLQIICKFLVTKSFSFLVEWKSSNTHGFPADKSGLELLMVFLERLIDPQRTTESAALFTGDIISKLISHGRDQIQSVLPALVYAIVKRLNECKLPSTIQSFITPLSHLASKDAQGLVNLLKSINIAGRSGLDIVLNLYCDNLQDFSGYFGIKINIFGLSQIAALLEDPDIQNVMVKGEIVANPAENHLIMTRSRRKKVREVWTSVSFFTKAYKILWDYYEDDAEIRKEVSLSTAEGEDEDWEEEEDDVKYLNELMDDNDFEDQVEDDEDDKLSPIFSLDMKNYLKECFIHLQNYPEFVNILSK